jgi:hypothetical protein
VPTLVILVVVAVVSPVGGLSSVVVLTVSVLVSVSVSTGVSVPVPVPSAAFYPVESRPVPVALVSLARAVVSVVGWFMVPSVLVPRILCAFVRGVGRP